MKDIRIPKIRPQKILMVVFLLVLLMEGYLFYIELYSKLSPEAEAVPVENLVRLNVASYNKTLDSLDEIKSFIADPWDIDNTNPF